MRKLTEGTSPASRWTWTSCRSPRLLLALLIASLLVGGCSIRKLAVRTLADALAEGTDVYATDDDPDLVGQALPFALKTLEGLLESDPQNVDLLLAACQGFTQYSYGFAELEALWIEGDDYTESRRQQQRALRLYLRARDYCLRGLDVRHPGLSAQLRRQPAATLATTTADDVELLFWTAGAWGSAISMGTHRPDLVIDLPVVRALVEHLLATAPDYADGLVQEAAMVLYSLPANLGGDPERSVRHRDLAIELSGGQRASVFVTWAETVDVARQDRDEFRTMLKRALAVDIDADPQGRLANVLAQRKARHLLDHIDDLFLPPLDDP